MGSLKAVSVFSDKLATELEVLRGHTHIHAHADTTTHTYTSAYSIPHMPVIQGRTLSHIVLNAGVCATGNRTTADGYELGWGVM